MRRLKDLIFAGVLGISSLGCPVSQPQLPQQPLNVPVEEVMQPDVPVKDGIQIEKNIPPTVESLVAKVGISETTVTVELKGNDKDGDPLTYSITKDAEHGNVTLDGNNLVYQLRDVDFRGEDIVSYIANDGIDSSEEAIITFNVIPEIDYWTNMTFIGFKIAENVWISYAPRNFDPTKDIYPSVESIRNDLELLKEEGFSGIITYDVKDTLGEIPRIAKEVGFNAVFTGIWFTKEGGLLERAISTKEYSDAFIIGNELLNESEGYSLEQLVSAARTVRNATKLPVTTTEQFDDYLSNQDLLDFGEFLAPNIHPYWLGIKNPKEAAAKVKELYNELKELADDKTILIKETGMPTGGEAWLDESIQLEFFRELIGDYVDRISDVNYQPYFSFFEAFDQPWKDWANVEPYWGLHTSSGEKKFFINAYTPPVPIQGDECLSRDAIVFFERNYRGIGGLRHGRSDLRGLADCPDFDIYGRHFGGFGDTLEMRSTDNGVHLTWAYDNLGYIIFGPNWQGRTNRGIKIGSTVDEFKQLYPSATICSDPTIGSFYDPEHIRAYIIEETTKRKLVAEFDENQRMIGMVILHEFRERREPCDDIGWLGFGVSMK